VGTDVANAGGAFGLTLRDGALKGIRVGMTADDTKGLILDKAISGCKSSDKGLADSASDGAPVGLIVSVGILTDGGDADGASDGAPVGLIVSVGILTDGGDADGASDGAPVGLIVSVGILTDGGDADGASDGAPVGLIVSVGVTVTSHGGIALGIVLDPPASPLTASDDALEGSLVGGLDCAALG
jgi:hypothetical protein